ncbi:unnamed protein product [Brassicogethes aeneus]|uniref:PID domain-containing protein n=1 Tax=Brassicogethes aeneus TaxID=1431903 RepID=A0A9P0FDL2_BRAAE|nr:unnamed protein product [Brassicogethes aeneus]
MTDTEIQISAKDLPKKFHVKYLGTHPVKGLYGMKNTRKPVDSLVTQAKSIGEKGQILPLLDLEVNVEGIKFVDITNKKHKSDPVQFGVDVISYGVQDLIYTRVFTIIVLTSTCETINPKAEIPFVCHTFLCNSRQEARELTFSLAAAFQDYGARVKRDNLPAKKFAIDLRTPEEQADDEDIETDA